MLSIPVGVICLWCAWPGEFCRHGWSRELAEYAVKFLGTTLIVVLGHDKCGAVGAAIDAEKGATLPGHLPELVEHIIPAVKAAKGKPGDDLLDEVDSSENVLHDGG